jgi:hypothetical protein
MTYYSEERCALNGWQIFHGTFWLVLFFAIAMIGGAAGIFLISLLALIPLWAFMHTLGTLGLWWCWWIDIRIDSEGIRIGGLRRAERRARKGIEQKYPELPSNQRRQVFFCPWDAVRRVEVVTDRDELKKLRWAAPDIGWKRIKTVRLGRLWSPYMRAALVINLDPDRASFPWILQADEEFDRGWLGTMRTNREPVRSPVWIAPTRHPDELRTALERHGVPVA